MESTSAMILALLINICNIIDAKLNAIPRNTEMRINNSTYMNCSTSLQAELVQWRHGSNYVYTGIAILEPYNDGRFFVEINNSTGASNLVIRSVQPSDAGTYECGEDEGFGEKSTAELIVLESDPVCKSNMHSDGVIGPNSCDIEPEEVKLSCSIKFHGNTPPVLQWRASGDNQSISGELINLTSINNEVTYTLTMKSSLSLNNSSYVCQTSRTSDKYYSCSSDAINILYAFSSEVTVVMTVNDEVNCFANTSQSCSYKWKWFDGDDVSTESDNQNLKAKKAGMHRCEATCSIRNDSCSVQSMRATVHLEEGTSGQNRMPLLALLLVPALTVIGVIMYCWRKRKVERQRLDEIELQRREQEKRQRLGLLDTFTVYPMANAKLDVRGECTMKITQDSIRLFDPRDNRREIVSWPLDTIRRYGVSQNMFTIEAGRLSPTGEGVFIFDSEFSKNIFRRVRELIGVLNKYELAGRSREASDEAYARHSSGLPTTDDPQPS